MTVQTERGQRTYKMKDCTSLPLYNSLAKRTTPDAAEHSGRSSNKGKADGDHLMEKVKKP